jgi:mRNA-degrading endonuclease RelE of RelBE toxin-antitoxin system
MARIEIVKTLFEEIERIFKKDSETIFDLIESVAENPRKGKTLGTVGGTIIKELRYASYRFYFITDGHTLKVGDADAIASLLIKFIKMSDKKHQQQAIDEIKDILRSMGFEAF